MLDASSVTVVLDAYGPERSALLDLLGALSPADLARPTECPQYSVHGVALHVLGDDLSLLSRQRDRAENGVALLSTELTGADFRTLLDTFNDRFVAATRFLSPALVVELLRLTGDWTEAYYRDVDPEAPGEAVGLFGAPHGGTSPLWHAIAREYMERLIHHSQIRRALGLSSVVDRPLLVPGVEVAAAIARLPAGIPTDPGDPWRLGDIVLGPAEQAADILTRAHSCDEVRHLASGPSDLVELFAAVAGRP